MNENMNEDMNEHMNEDDEMLLAELKVIVAQVDPPPPLLQEMGRQSFRLFQIDLELAQLMADSRTESHLVRSTAVADPRLMSFETTELGIDIQISEYDSSYVILGQLSRNGNESDPQAILDTPALLDTRALLGARAFLDTPAGEVAAEIVESDGRFEFRIDIQSARSRGRMVRIRVESADVASIASTWIEL